MLDPLPPYAELLGLRTERGGDGALLWVMPFREEVVGRPGFLHGGAIAGLLEFAAFGTLYEALGPGASASPINVSVDFMRGGADHDTFASAVVTRLGSRVANVEAHAWQQDRSRPIAAARMNLMVRRFALSPSVEREEPRSGEGRGDVGTAPLPGPLP